MQNYWSNYSSSGISLPSDYRELFIELCAYHDGKYICHTFHFLKSQLRSVSKQYIGGHYYSNVDNSIFAITLTDTNISNILAIMDSGTYAIDAEFVIYYK